MEESTYIIFNTSEIGTIDYSQVEEISPSTTRKTQNESLSTVRWLGEIPSSVNALNTKQGPYNYNEALVILSQPEWIITGSLYY
jgi:hypothetical protein